MTTQIHEAPNFRRARPCQVCSRVVYGVDVCSACRAKERLTKAHERQAHHFAWAVAIAAAIGGVIGWWLS